MTFGSLFTGIGGLDLGLERAGMECRWQVEIDPYCRKVLAKHWPNVKRFSDVKEVGAHNLSPVDLICGGFPCQPFSSASAGRRSGTEDNRWLWPEMYRAVVELEPSWVLCENVPHFDGLGLDQVVSDLEGSGYEVAPVLEIPACAVGCDHRRSRLWILGYSDSNCQSGRAVNAEASVLQGGGGVTGGMGAQDGLSGRLDRHRLKGLGNAVVPQVAEYIGRLIMAAARTEETL